MKFDDLSGLPEILNNTSRGVSSRGGWLGPGLAPRTRPGDPTSDSRSGNSAPKLRREVPILRHSRSKNGQTGKASPRILARDSWEGQEHQDNPVRTVYLPPYKQPLTGWNISKFEGRWSLIEGKLK